MKRRFVAIAGIVTASSALASCGASVDSASSPSGDAARAPGQRATEARAIEARDATADDETGIPRRLFLSELGLEVAPEVLARAVEVTDEDAFAEELRLEFEQHGLLPDETKARFPGLAPLGEKGDRFVVEGLRARVPKGRPDDEWSAPSFVIDYDEPVLRELVAKIPKAERTPRGLERYVHDFIGKKTYTRGFDIASRVAALAQGDCTEHAVLLTALLRAVGIPARVLVGVVIVVSAEGALAAGHAWVEYHADSSWRRLDAALYRAPDARADESGSAIGVPSADAVLLGTHRRVYWPTFVFSDEGPGFASFFVRVHAGSSMSGLSLGLRADRRARNATK